MVGLKTTTLSMKEEFVEGEFSRVEDLRKRWRAAGGNKKTFTLLDWIYPLVTGEPKPLVKEAQNLGVPTKPKGVVEQLSDAYEAVKAAERLVLFRKKELQIFIRDNRAELRVFEGILGESFESMDARADALEKSRAEAEGAAAQRKALLEEMR